MAKELFASQSVLHEGQRSMTSERLVNMYAEAAPRSRLPITLRSSPGLKEIGQFNSGRVHAMLANSDGIYAVVGDAFSLWNGSTFTRLGTVADAPATMAYNGSQIAITAGGQYWIWDGTSLTRVRQGAFTSYGSVAYVDGYFALTEANGPLHSVTGLYDGTTINALDFASAEHRPDPIYRVITSGGLIWYMGSETVEPWQNVGSADFPFAPVQSTVLEKGLRSGAEVALLDNSFFWISTEPKVYRQTNFVPERISTHSVEAWLKKGGRTVVFPLQWDGHDWLVVRPDNGPAWIYDVATQSWHERASDVLLTSWDATASVFASGKWYIGTDDGYLCEMSGSQERGHELRREATTATISAGGDQFSVDNLWLKAESGSGGNMLWTYSHDGRVFHPEQFRSLGAVGKYQIEQRWFNLGQFTEFAFRVACTDDVDFAIYEAGLNGSP